jgi:hypothetical protein
MLHEVTGIGQLEFGFGFIFFLSFLLDMSLAAGAGRHFHGAFPFVFLGAKRREARVMRK